MFRVKGDFIAFIVFCQEIDRSIACALLYEKPFLRKMLQPFQGCLLAQGKMEFHVTSANIFILFQEIYHLVPQLFFGILP